MAPQGKAVGSCSCRSVKYVVRLPVKFCVHCHCLWCRRAVGAAFVTWFGVARASLRLGGKEHLKWYKASPIARRGFCGNCGSALLFVSHDWPDDVHVNRASVIGDADIVPQAHIFYDQHVDWACVGDSLPRLGDPGGLGSGAAHAPSPETPPGPGTPGSAVAGFDHHG
jgi:hypothetical protein